MWKRFSHSWRELLFFLIGALAILTGHWTAEEWKHAFDHWVKQVPGPGPHPLFLTLFTVLFLLCSFGLFKLRKIWWYPRSRVPVTNLNPPKREVLILFLPVLDTLRGRFQDNGLPEGITLSGDWKRDLQLLEAKKEQKEQPVRWIWEVPLRPIRHHLGKLRTLIIVCSRESVRQAHWFRKLLRDTYGSSLADVGLLLLLAD